MQQQVTRKALKIEPECVEAHNNLAAVLIKLGQPEAAIASYRQALELAPEQAAGT